MFDMFQYGFMLRGLEAGVLVALIAPLIGIFLVLRRYSLIADTLAHVSLAGVALGFILRVPPLIAAIFTSVIASFYIERLRFSKRLYGESALAVFLSGSLAAAVVLMSFARGLNTNFLNYLFGSILTVTQSEIYVIGCVGFIVMVGIGSIYKELIYTTFDEESAAVSGLRVRLINTVFVMLAALAVSISIPIVGVLLVSALIVIPVVSALQFRKSFTVTLFIAEVLSLMSVVSGLFVSYALNLPAGGVIVLISIFFLWFIRGVTKR